MNTLVVVDIFIVLLHLHILVSLTTASEIGISSCMYLGEFEDDGEKCHKDVVKVKRLPKQCSSFVYDGVIICQRQQDYTIECKDSTYGLERLGSLVEYEGRAHPVFLFYSHGTLENWYKELITGDFSLVAQSVQKFIGGYPVIGLILRDLDDPTLCNNDENFYQKFTAYIKAIKDINPSLEIGLYLSANLFIKMVDLYKADKIYYFDFSKINEIVDFYIIEFASFNTCSKDLLHGGITPMDSSDPNVLSLNQFAAVLDNSTIAKDKLYFEFLISPKLRETYSCMPCEVSYNEYCENEDDKESKLCADNSDVLYSKGAFAAKYAKGFIGRYIDLVDRDDKCGCGKYVTFEIMVNGYNSDANPNNCEKLKGV